MNSTRFTLGAILASAFAASLCCLGPLIVALLGLGGAGIFQRFEVARPYAMVVTAALLAYGFYRAYRPEQTCAEGNVCAAKPGIRNLGKVTIWLAAILAIGLMGFPYYSGRLLARALQSSAPAAAATQSASTTLKVTGMTCGGCAMKVKQSLLALPGVISAEVSQEEGEATIRHDPRLKPQTMIAAIQAAGYGASLP